MLKESSLEKWFKFEMAKLNSGVVVKKKPLKELVKEERPKTKAKDGSLYYFNKEELLKLKTGLPENMASVMLPISFYISLDTRKNVYIAEKASLDLLKHLGEVPRDSELSDGRYWMSKVLVTDLMKRHPTIFQFVRY